MTITAAAAGQTAGDESKAVREAMRRLLEQRFDAGDDVELSTAEIFDSLSRDHAFAKPIDLSRALLDLMDERVVQWNKAFQLVRPTTAATADR
ncbi:MAG: hypothetical protein MUD17_05405 [Gemmatimonadaceae bacterium]|jgi:Arc/MetJ-type ribon-helix-helix transcriptional regulator|nr:hypothetical protein [Gemmatimonadaceae bacterium]